jgi:hypothetical protein
MRFNFFNRRPAPHVRKSLDYLTEANLALVEHQAAAEHHAALAKMYAARIIRIEAELKNAALPPSLVTHQRVEQANGEAELAIADSVVAYPALRATRS